MCSFLGISPSGTTQTAVEWIVEEHNERPASSDDPIPVGPIQRWALELLPNPAVLLPEGAEMAYEALSVNRSRTVRSSRGTIRRDLANDLITPTAAAARIVEVAHSFGLREVEPAEPLTEITEDDVGVVCWLGSSPNDKPVHTSDRILRPTI